MASCKECLHYEVCEFANDTEYADLNCLKYDCGYFIDEADVVEVKHGYCKDNNNGTFTCSVCGGKASKMNWCGCCGAKMDKGGEQNAF